MHLVLAKVCVQFLRNGNDISVIIRDNGPGFNKLEYIGTGNQVLVKATKK